MQPNDAATRQTKIRRYQLILAKGRHLVQDHPDAANLHELRQLMLQAAQAQSIVAGTAEARQQMLDMARELADSDAPIAVRMQADSLLTHAQIARHGRRSDGAAAAVARFADKYRNTQIEAQSTMRAVTMAFEIRNRELLESLESRLTHEFKDDPQVVAFLRDRLGKRIDHILVNALLERSDSEGYWRLPMDILGRPVTVTFWASAIDDLEDRMLPIKQIQHDNPKDVFLMGINLDPDKDMARHDARRLGLDYPQVYRGRGATDPFFLLFSNSNIPSVSYFRPDGRSASVVSDKFQQKGGRDDLGRTNTKDQEPPALALTYLRSGEFLVTRPVGPTDPAAPPELGDPDTARAAMAALQGPRLPEGTLQSIQECFTVPPRRYRLGKPITGKFDRPDRQPAAELYETAIERCERALTKHPDAADLFLVRNRLMVALVGLSAIRTDPSLTRRAAEVGHVVLENKSIPQTAKLLADVCALRWKLREQMDHATMRDALRAFVARYAGGHREPHAVAMAAILALELGDGKLHKDLVHVIQRHHRLNQDMRPFLWHFEDDRETGRELRAKIPLLDGGILNLPDDWHGRAGVVIFIACSDDSQVMAYRATEMDLLKEHWYNGKEDKQGPDALHVLYAVIGGSRQEVQDLAEQHRWPWPVAYSGPGWDDPLAQAYRGPGTQKGYSMLVVDPNGIIVRDKRGSSISQNFDSVVQELSGRAALADGKFAEAAAAFQVVVDRAGYRRPTPRTCMLMARARAGLGQWNDAQDWIDRARKFAEDAGTGQELLDEIESLRERIDRDSENSDTPHSKVNSDDS
jgi:hypothetical protein